MTLQQELVLSASRLMPSTTADISDGVGAFLMLPLGQ